MPGTFHLDIPFSLICYFDPLVGTEPTRVGSSTVTWFSGASAVIPSTWRSVHRRERGSSDHDPPLMWDIPELRKPSRDVSREGQAISGEATAPAITVRMALSSVHVTDQERVPTALRS